jgi:hypothetical protein
MAHGDAREGKWRGNWRMEWLASTLHTTSKHGVSSITTTDAHRLAACSRLNWRPFQFKWTRLFAEKQNLVSARVPSHFKRNLLFIPCVISNKFAKPNQRNAQKISLDIYITISLWTSLHISVQKGPSPGNQTKVMQHKIKYKYEQTFKIHNCTNIHKTEKQNVSYDNQYNAYGCLGNSLHT